MVITYGVFYSFFYLHPSKGKYSKYCAGLVHTVQVCEKHVDIEMRDKEVLTYVLCVQKHIFLGTEKQCSVLIPDVNML